MLSIMLFVVGSATVIAMTSVRLAARRTRRALVARQRDDAPDVRARRSGL